MDVDLQRRLAQLASPPDFVRRYPQFTYVLSRLEPFADPAVDVMGVSARGAVFRLHVNVEFFEQYPEFLCGVLLHEVHHVVLGHVTDPKFSWPDHPDLMQFALEVSANEHVIDPLPGCPVRWQSFGHLGLAPGQSSLDRYALLVEARRAGRLPETLHVHCVDDHLPEGVGRVGLGPRGRALPGALPLRAIRRELARRRAPGIGAGELIERLTASRPARALLDWRVALRAFVQRRPQPEASLVRPNRRFPERVGEIPGRVRRARQARRPKLLVAIDTSASMSAGELALVANELAELQARADLTIAECDAEIRRVYRFEGALASVWGRGGTDLRPVFRREFLRAHDPDGVVYFTDGCGPWPERPPPVRTLWVLSKPDGFRCPWGLRARLAVSGSPSRRSA